MSRERNLILLLPLVVVLIMLLGAVVFRTAPEGVQASAPRM
jgi:hypothetical protein